MRLMLLVFGKEYINYLQAYFCILSFLKEKADISINIVTDNPSYFARLSRKATIISVTQDEIKSWRGESDFFWRIKCKAVEKIVKKHPGDHIIYVDSDTFLGGGLSRIQSILDAGNCLMHINEGKLSEEPGKTKKDMWKKLGNKTFCGINIDKVTCMWNAGVIAIPGSQSSYIIDKVLEVCDEMCRINVRRVYLEQLSFSIVLFSTFDLYSSNKWIGHYWGNKKEWRKLISDFIFHSYFRGQSLEEEIERVINFDFLALPLIKREKNTNKRIKKFADRFFPIRGEVYFTRKRI